MGRGEHSEVRVLSAAWRSFARRPLALQDVEPGWRRFGAMETAAYGNVVTILLLLLFIEMPAVHVILGAVMEDGVTRSVIRWLLLGSSIYVAVWLIGDLRLLRETPGVLLGREVLIVELGARVDGQIALSNVRGAQRLRAPDSEPRTIRVTPLQPPNCRIRLRSAVFMRGMWGIPLSGEVLDLYVDDPAGLVTAIEERQSSAGSLCSPSGPSANASE